MKRYDSLLRVTALCAISTGLVACGPSLVELDPRSVVNVHVAPASKQPLFCPGDAFQVEVVAKLKDGTSCSSTDRARGCMGKKDAIIDPADVRVSGSSGRNIGKKDHFVWLPEADPLKTAGTGMKLKGWLEKVIDGATVKSVEGEMELRPVYECRKEATFNPPQYAKDGSPGGAGPNLVIAVTSLSTPYYPDAALIRVEYDANRVYMISPSADQPVRIFAKGQSGAEGAPGVDGRKGEDGKDAMQKTQCARGTDGLPGGNGGDGKAGGDGGPGGTIRVMLDERIADKLKGRLLLSTPGGEPGLGGRGGKAGPGGRGGAGGPKAESCPQTDGERGKDGEEGKPGTRGKHGPDAGPPTFENAPREKLFATELSLIANIEATKAKR
jgi:hypothetical protein